MRHMPMCGIEAAERVATAKLDVLCAGDQELLDLAAAECSSEADAAMIRDAIQGDEKRVQALIIGLIRDNVCGVDHSLRDQLQASPPHSQPHAGSPGSPHSLPLPLDVSDVSAAELPPFEGSALRILSFVRWLRYGPHVQRLAVSAQQLSPRGCLLLAAAVDEGLLHKLGELVVLDDGPDGELRALAERVRESAFSREPEQLQTLAAPAPALPPETQSAPRRNAKLAISTRLWPTNMPRVAIVRRPTPAREPAAAAAGVSSVSSTAQPAPELGDRVSSFSEGRRSYAEYI